MNNDPFTKEELIHIRNALLLYDRGGRLGDLITKVHREIYRKDNNQYKQCQYRQD